MKLDDHWDLSVHPVLKAQSHGKRSENNLQKNAPKQPKLFGL